MEHFEQNGETTMGEIEWQSVKVTVINDSSCEPICSFNEFGKEKIAFWVMVIDSDRPYLYKKSQRHKISISTCNTWNYEIMTITRNPKNKTALLLFLCLDYHILIYVLP